MMKSFLACALLASGALSGAFVASPAQAAEVSRLAATCAGCHGAGGASTEKSVPIIGGLSSEYIHSVLVDFKTGDRKNCVETTVRSGARKGTKTDMCRIAKELSPGDMKRIAAFYAGKKFVRAKQVSDEDLARKGKAIFSQDCEKCHSEGGSAAADDAGILAGQWKPYLRAQLDDYRSGKRAMPDKMAQKLQKLTPLDIDALVEYFGSFR